jgi:hypothetical protein
MRHRLDACFAKLEREVSLGNYGNQCVVKYAQILLSLSYERNSPTISIVMTFMSFKSSAA